MSGVRPIVVLGLLAAAPLGAQTATPVVAPPAPPAPSPPPIIVMPAPAPPPAPIERGPLKLTGSTLYVYNFLDIRADTYSDKVITEFERQLNEWLATRVKATGLIRSAETPYMKREKLRKADDWSSSVTGNSVSQRVPVMESIYSNRRAEAEIGADYRLVVFPASFETAGAWRYYSIRWVVMRIGDGKSWQHVYSGQHMVMLKESERAESRSKKFIAAIDKAMLDAGLFAD